MSANSGAKTTSYDENYNGAPVKIGNADNNIDPADPRQENMQTQRKTEGGCCDDAELMTSKLAEKLYNTNYINRVSEFDILNWITKNNFSINTVANNSTNIISSIKKAQGRTTTTSLHLRLLIMRHIIVIILMTIMIVIIIAIVK